ncbi:gastric triacylglycerol lipase-like isoform X2 [Oculina patagonica]
MSVASLLILCSAFLAIASVAVAIGHRDLPEEHMNVTQIIHYNGYPAEEYHVTTDDGYVITIQRIPAGRKEVFSDGPKPVIFLQHGLLCSSSNWVTNLPNESFAFILADAGFDVWLGNVRGNTYGLHHIKYPVDSDEFWDFSWDEMARYDLPAMLKFVLSKTSQPSLFYAGHSQGTLIAFAEFSRNKELANMVKKFFALGPVTTVGHIESPIKYLAYFIPEIETRLPVYYSHTPAGTSVRDMVHFAQMTLSNKFQMYNFGSAEKNREHYGQDTPPLYNVSAMTVPVALYWAQNDWLADPTDVRALLPLLPNKMYDKYIENWDHLDFIWGLDAAKIVYNDIIKNMKMLL